MEKSAKLYSLNQRLSGFRTVARRDVGKALVRSLEVAFGKDGAKIDGDCKVGYRICL